TLERNRALVEAASNIRFHSGIPESDLLSMYQSASILLVPFKDGTANNSVLEAAACGLPAITTDIGGIRDYVDDACAVLCKPCDAECMADAVIMLLKNVEKLERMGRLARQSAERFSWPLVAAAMKDAYAKVFYDAG
ncbi:MAG: glycosyltransferase family 4 protein, partial [Deltaproteobacteria bacterium]|nr:glycosyltransferase family 4 protein [Deltaproteobacteria bacterium]